MTIISLNDGPTQNEITEQHISEMLSLHPRRMKYSVEHSGLYGLRPPYREGSDWSVRFPFQETYRNAFDAVCFMEHDGIRVDDKGRCYAYLTDTCSHEEPPERPFACCEALGRYVAIRDLMALSFALDYDRETGNPSAEYTQVGRLRNQAKPRDGSEPEREEYRQGVKGLHSLVTKFLDDMMCYSSVDSVVAMPSSNPARKYNVPKHLAYLLNRDRGILNLSEHIKTVSRRAPLKDTKSADRLNAIKGTIAVDANVFSDT